MTSGRSIPPAFEWAQSVDSVFLNVKFSHKWDTPSTLGCVEEGVNITNSSFVVDVVCKAKGKHFLLSLDVFGELNAEVVVVRCHAFSHAYGITVCYALSCRAMQYPTSLWPQQ